MASVVLHGVYQRSVLRVSHLVMIVKLLVLLEKLARGHCSLPFVRGNPKETRQSAEIERKVGGSQVELTEHSFTCKYLYEALLFYCKSTDYI